MQFADGFVTAAAAQPSMVVLFRAVNGEPSTFGLNQTAQQSTRSERRDRCLVNAHFNLNEPRTALRKHKVGDWKRQARGTVPMRPAADVEAPEASAQPFPDTAGPLIPEGVQKPPVRCNHDEEVLPEHCACRRRLCSQAVRFLLWCAHDGQFHLLACARRALIWTPFLFC